MLGRAQDFYADIKAGPRAARATPITVLPGLSPFIGSTDARGQDPHDELNELTERA